MFDTLPIQVFFVLAVITALYWILVAGDVAWGIRKVEVLRSDESELPDSLPLVSIVVTAKDEEDSIANALQSVKNIDYPHYEVIVVNDRSTDRTLEKIRSVKKGWEQLKVVTIEELPEGWLGKNYACYRGFLASTGDIVVFTDADVLFKPLALKAAVALCMKHNADHLAVSPMIYGESFFARLFIQYFLFSFLIYFRPWSGGIGVGAFNMFTRTAYEEVGTHRGVALRPDEDLQLGKRVKKRRMRQLFASGKRLLSVCWYSSLWDAMVGVEKNTFAGLGYNSFIAVGAISGQLLLFFFPFIAVFITSGWSQMLYAGVIFLMGMVYIKQMSVFSSRRPIEVVLLPLSAALFIVIISRALIKTLIKRGIEWRGTYYPLHELRKTGN